MMVLRIFNVEHGACAIIAGPNDSLAMIDCGHNSTTGWRPNDYLRNTLNARNLNYLLITNVDLTTSAILRPWWAVASTSTT